MGTFANWWLCGVLVMIAGLWICGVALKLKRRRTARMLNQERWQRAEEAARLADSLKK